MQVARPTFLKKGNNIITSVVRNTSCSKGWLRVVVQSIFATITVVSFILIVLMSVKKSPHPPHVMKPTVPSRCQINSCRVICNDAPYFDDYYEDIILSVTDAETECLQVVLELNTPYFANNTLPENWLSNMRSNIHQLIITGGNLEYIANGAFMSQFSGNIRILMLHQIYIKTMEPTSLVGLSRLRNFNIVNSRIGDISHHALRAVDDTLERLTVSECGDWDPVNFTGAEGFQNLGIVDFSYNDYNEILNRYTFVGLGVTKILYLNSCRITAIGVRTFDHLTNIEVLYLNNNMLITVPPGLFSIILALENPRPRVNLQDNYWLCDCSVDDLRQLVRKDVLLIDATCTYPTEAYGKKFTEFENKCNNNTAKNYRDLEFSNVNETESIHFYPDHFYVNGSYCTNKKLNSKIVRIISPVQRNECTSIKFISPNFTTLVNRNDEFSKPNDSLNEWIRFSYFVRTKTYSVVQIGPKVEESRNGILWYDSECPHEVYCLDSMPTFLRVYSINTDASYIFCPIFINSASIQHDQCVGYDFCNLDKLQTYQKNAQRFQIILYMATAITCLCFGAFLIYGLIRSKPTLLRGSKRILFVKHKNLDALVLPPKVPLRYLESDADKCENKNIFTLSTDQKTKLPNLKRIKSVKSDKSGSPSYISAMQPTDDQLAEWRIRHHFNNDLTISSVRSEFSSLSGIGETYYNSLDDRTYESLK